MAADVRRCVAEILREHGGVSPEEAEQLIRTWQRRDQGREPSYIEDIWC